MMKILIVASYNKNRFAPFIVEQADALKKQQCEIAWFGLQGKGLMGYLKNLSALKKKIIMAPTLTIRRLCLFLRLPCAFLDGISLFLERHWQ